jgi:thiol:disulfide interchange protein
MIGSFSMTSNFFNRLLKAAISMLLSFFLASSLAAFAQSEFHVNRDLYSETADPTADIAAAVKAARPAHKRVLLEFGGNWCADCQLLDFYYRQAPNADLLAKHYVVVRVDIGHMDHNMDIANRYHVPVAKGVPALAILDSNGKLLFSEQPKEFEHTSPEAITAFLNHWKG